MGTNWLKTDLDIALAIVIVGLAVGLIVGERLGRAWQKDFDSDCVCELQSGSAPWLQTKESDK